MLFTAATVFGAESSDIGHETFTWFTDVLKETPNPVFVIILRVAFTFAVYSILCGQIFKNGAPNTFVIPALALLASVVVSLAFPFHKIAFKPGMKALLLFLSLIAVAIIPYFGARWLSDDPKFHERYRMILYGAGFALFVLQFASL